MFFSLLAPAMFLPGCDKDDPEPVNEEELITTVVFTLTPAGGGNPAVFEFRDIDGIGGAAPMLMSDTLAAGSVYTGSIALFNESLTPPEDIGEEVKEEGDAHQFFFQVSGGLELSFSYGDQDENGKPLGLETQWTTGAAGEGTIRVILRHLPDKDAPGVSSGEIANAGGETDAEVEWPMVIQ